MSLAITLTKLQSFEVRDKEGKLVAGSPSPKPVEEYWVFERKLVKNAPWRFVAKIKPEDD
jgi:predicted lipid-binding transport protein (Tim44 family)